MNKTVILIALVALAVTFIQCKQKKNTRTSMETTATQQQLPNEKNDRVMVDSEYRWPGSTDPFEIVSVKTEGDSLKVEVQYGGGCRDHIFSLHTNLLYMKSLPPQLNLYLEHKNNGDNCRALLRETLHFNIHDVRYSGVRQVKIIVNNDREKMVEYAY